MNVTMAHVMQTMEYALIQLVHLHVPVLQDSLVMDLLAEVTHCVSV